MGTPNKFPKVKRDSILFVGGFVGVFHETVASRPSERPYLLAVFMGMMGLPFFMHLDTDKADKKESDKP